jgi:oxygen-independent coproporphyrinogen-3 oxidase
LLFDFSKASAKVNSFSDITNYLLYFCQKIGINSKIFKIAKGKRLIMAGIYIHIPFCQKRCTYCDFYSVVAPQLIPEYINCIGKELKIRKDYLPESEINTIYFGGGTPSLLNKAQFKNIFDIIFSEYSVNENPEITFEANPDDLTTDFFSSIRSLPFNRISIGIQSFDNEDLKRIHRRHAAIQAVEAVRNAQRTGFKNISIDLIYGLPLQSLQKWEKQLDTALNLNVQHISVYGLTYEKGTVLWKQREKGIINEVDEETMYEMYVLLVKKMKQNGFDAYEISNFALPNFRSRHNSSYWKQESYIGIGPSAHSYDLKSRQWNVASISDYIKAIENNSGCYEREELTFVDRYNDFIIVSLRTKEGINLKTLENEFGPDMATYCMENIKPFIESKKVDFSDKKLRLTTNGILISNQILMQLMKV